MNKALTPEEENRVKISTARVAVGRLRAIVRDMGKMQCVAFKHLIKDLSDIAEIFDEIFDEVLGPKLDSSLEEAKTKYEAAHPPDEMLEEHIKEQSDKLLAFMNTPEGQRKLGEVALAYLKEKCPGIENYIIPGPASTREFCSRCKGTGYYPGDKNPGCKDGVCFKCGGMCVQDKEDSHSSDDDWEGACLGGLPTLSNVEDIIDTRKGRYIFYIDGDVHYMWKGLIRRVDIHELPELYRRREELKKKEGK